MKLNQMCLPIRTGMAAILFFILIFGLINPILGQAGVKIAPLTGMESTLKEKPTEQNTRSQDYYACMLNCPCGYINAEGDAVDLSSSPECVSCKEDCSKQFPEQQQASIGQPTEVQPVEQPSEGTGDPYAWEKLGIEYWNKGYSAMDALNAFEMAIKQDPKDDTAMLNGGLVWFYDAESTGIEGDYANALEWFNNSINVDPNYAEAWYYRGSACQKLGDYYMSIGSYVIATQYYNMATEAFDTSTGLTCRIGGLDGLPIKKR